MILNLVLGLVLLLVGGEVLVRGAVALAERMRISPLVIGVTLVGFGTSAPELVTCIDAALADAPGLAIGNIVGSNIANVLLVLAIGALLYPIKCTPSAFRRDGPFIALAAIICTLVVLAGSATRPVGAVLLAVLIGYLVWTALAEQKERAAAKREQEAESSNASAGSLINLALTLFGMGAIVFGADRLVTGSIDLARYLGASEALIGLTIVAIGTSLPELVTTVIAALKRQGDVALGNIIGSNIFNSLGILGVTAMVRPIAIPADIAAFDIWVMLAATAAMLVFAITSWRINRIEGGVLLAGYIAYMGVLTQSA